MDAISMLLEDHKKMRKLLDELESTTERGRQDPRRSCSPRSRAS